MISPVSRTPSFGALFALQRNQSSLAEVMKRLATGHRINAGKDDPAGLIASERLGAEIASREAETRALQRADSNARIAEGHGAELSALFTDLASLVISSANQAGMSDAELAANQMQIDNTVASIQRFHGDAVRSLDGINMPGGGNAAAEASLDGALAAALSVSSGGANDLSSGNLEAAGTAINDAALNVATARGRIGGFQKDVIGPEIRSNQVAIENLTESRSRIVDADFAVETSNLAREQVLVAASIKVLDIAQQQARTVLDLLS